MDAVEGWLFAGSAVMVVSALTFWHWRSPADVAASEIAASKSVPLHGPDRTGVSGGWAKRVMKLSTGCHDVEVFKSTGAGVLCGHGGPARLGVSHET